jgi:AcrR family transcriptional regulator
VKTKEKASIRNKRDDVLRATLKLTAERGFTGTSTANIAEEAGVGVGTIYRYFRSKDELYTALFNELRSKFMQLLLTQYNFSLDVRTNFRNIVFVVVNYYIEHPYEFKYLERYSDAGLRIDQKFNETTLGLEPLRKMLNGSEYGLKFKKLPFFILFAMAYGPLVAIVNLVHMGKVELTDELLYEIADSIWESIVEE